MVRATARSGHEPRFALIARGSVTALLQLIECWMEERRARAATADRDRWLPRLLCAKAFLVVFLGVLIFVLKSHGDGPPEELLGVWHQVIDNRDDSHVVERTLEIGHEGYTESYLKKSRNRYHVDWSKQPAEIEIRYDTEDASQQHPLRGLVVVQDDILTLGTARLDSKPVASLEPGRPQFYARWKRSEAVPGDREPADANPQGHLGRWKLEREMLGQLILAHERTDQLEMLVTEDRLIIVEQGRKTGTLTIEQERGEIDYTPGSGLGVEDPRLGLYKIENGELLLACAQPNLKRPSGFGTRFGVEVRRFTRQRK